MLRREERRIMFGLVGPGKDSDFTRSAVGSQ
jgi:hypothetical protein